MKKNLFDSFNRELELPLYLKLLAAVLLLAFGWWLGGLF